MVSPEDYQEKVDKVLKDYRKNAEIPGLKGKNSNGNDCEKIQNSY